MLRRSKSTNGPGLTFDHVSLVKRGPTLALQVPPGSSFAVMGPAASGKSQMLRAISGASDPTRGSIEGPQETLSLGDPDWSRRDTPMSIARQLLGKGSLQKSTEAISAVGLWDARQKSCLSLSPSQQTAAMFLPVILGTPKLVCADHHLDHLDWLVLESLWMALQELRQEGAILAYTTHRPDLGERAEYVLVLKAEQIMFSGTPEALRRTIAETTIEVATENRPGVRAITDPFEVDIEETAGGLRLQAKEGQTIASKLLLEGYGDVKYLVQRSPTFVEALTRLVG